MNVSFKRKKSRIMTLEYMRIIMTGVVFISHMEFLAHYSYGRIYTQFFHNATIGVDYFFILSGFGLMASQNADLISNKSIVALRYAVSKIKGLYWLYFSSMVLMIPYVLYISIQDNGILLGIILSGMKFLICGAMLQSLSGLLKFAHAYNGVGWFVSTIFICYCVSPILKKTSKILFYGKGNKVIRLICLIFFTAIFRSLLLFVDERTIFDDISYSSPFVRVFYVLLGMCIYQLYIQQTHSSDNKDEKNIDTLREFSVVILSIIWFLARNTMELILDRFFIYILDLTIVSYLVFCLANESGKISKAIRKSKIAKLGKDMMYIYLYHYPIRIYTDLVFENNRYVFGEITGVTEVVFIFVLTIIAYRTHKSFAVKKTMVTQ